MPDGSSTTRTVLKAGPSGATEVVDRLVTEAPMEIRLAGVPLAVIMRTPGDDEDLALGFALTEGIVGRPSDVAGVRPLPSHPEDSRWEVVLAEGVEVDPRQFQRNMYTTSSCGVCGKASIDAVRVTARPAAPGPFLSAAVLESMPGKLRAAQRTFEETGGLHAAGAFTDTGDLLALKEDVGRHNAVDKLVGALARSHWPLGPIVLMVSGRVSFEIVQKAAVAGIPMVCGVSAASSLAVDLADELGMTLIGFLRPGGFNVYSGPERLRL